MGGINHQPTKKSSEVLTVPAARALTSAMAHLMTGNTKIEDVITLSATLEFAGAHESLLAAADEFHAAHSDLGTLRNYIDQMLALFEKGYQPFETSGIDTIATLADFQARGMLPAAGEVGAASECFAQSGFNGTFHRHREMCEEAMSRLDALANLTTSLIHGPSATQGYFWFLVESNKIPWRQVFSQALTSLTQLLVGWQTTALLSTELHLTNVGMPSLLAAQDEPAVQQAEVV